MRLAFTIHHTFLGQGACAWQAWQAWRNVGLTTAGFLLGMGSPATLASELPRAMNHCLSLPSIESPAVECDRPSKAHKLPQVAAPPAANLSSADRRDRATEDAHWGALPQVSTIPPESAFSSVQNVEVAPEIIESSPVLRRWLEEVPDISVDIQHDPAFRTRLRVGYSEFPSTDNTGGVYVGVQDVFVGRTPLTLSAEYSTDGNGDRELIGADAQYYLLPLGWYGNFAPVVGYRSINNSTFTSEGINVGFRIILIPSRTGAADLSVTQSWVAPGTSEEVGLTTFAAGYAIAEDIRIGTDIQTQNTRDRQESRVSLLLEWML